MTGANTYTGATTIGAGVLQVGISSVGTTSSITSGAFGSGSLAVLNGAVLDLNGKTTLNALTVNGSGISAAGAIVNSDTNNAATISNTLTLGADSSIGGAGNIIIDGVVSGTNRALTKVGNGTVTLTATNTYSGATTINTGLLVIENDVPILNSSSYTGNGALQIQPKSTSFTTPFQIDSTRISSNLNTLTVGRPGNLGQINIGSDITTSGPQTYIGPVVLNGGNRTLTTTNSNIRFMGTVNSDSSARSLTISNGNSSVNFEGDVGLISPLSSISISSSSSTSNIAASIRTSGNQIYSGSVVLLGNSIFESTLGSISYKGTVNGAYDLSITIGSSGRVVFNSEVGGISPLNSITIGSLGITYINANVSTTGNINISNAILFGTIGVAQFSNGDFESDPVGSTTISSWTVSNTSVRLGVDPIGGFVTPKDLTYPANTQSGCNRTAGTGCDAAAALTFSTAITNDVQGAGDGSKSVRMNSSGSTAGYGIVRGPFIISNGTVTLGAGDSVSFKWKAQGGSDAYDVFGYLLNTSNGSVIMLLNATGASASATTSWATVTTSVPSGTSTADYKFVFISGSWDASGGTVLGAQLFIDSVSTSSTSSTDLFGTSACTTCRINAGSINFSSTVNLANTSVQLNVTSGSSISEVISGTGALTKQGAGTLTLSGNNSYSGTTTVSAGTLAVTHVNALGSTASGTTVASGATLDIRNVSIGAEPLTVNGGTLATSTGTSSLSGTVSLGGDSTINVAGTQLTLSNALSGIGFGINKTGSGALILSGVNTYTGDTLISNGTLRTTGTLSSSTDILMSNTAVWDLQAAQTIATLTMASGNSITRSTGTSSLTISGVSTIANSITTSGTQTY
ncbi:autotransporter-associated beta strand repeat-containing protein, partial [Polynucleobacter sp. MWH-Loch1C5]|uniref:beta strand repeat-containing protein n=1 Tax=Polynucleobacter sp. MWH-Loch1C5 TaxID=2689108 RepID=UPI001C0E602F